MQIRKDSILEDLQGPFSKPALVIKPFLLKVPVNKAHKELDLAYSTAYKIYNKIREAIYKFVKEDDMLSGEIEMGESCFGGKRAGKRKAKGKIPVFGLLEREGRVKVGAVKDVSAESILRETIKKVKRGSINGLVMYGFKHERIGYSWEGVYKRSSWSYAKEGSMSPR